MTSKRHTSGGEALTDLVLAVFRLNGRLLTAVSAAMGFALLRDRLTEELRGAQRDG